MRTQRRNTWLFLSFLLLAGAANLFSRTGIYALDSLMSCVNYVTYVGLLLFWIEAVRVRLLPSGARTCVLGAAGLMLLYILLRIFKYSFAVSVVPTRYAVYAYWIPQMLIPALFLMTCIRIRRGRQERQNRRDDLLLVPGAALSLLVMTNDLHALVYVPRTDLSRFVLDTGTYSLGPGFYLLYVWMILAAGSGLVLLFREAGRLPKKVLLLLAGVTVLWAGLVMLTLLVLDRLPTPFRMYNVPEIHIFCMLAVFEICVRNRLIPCNENYAGFFRKLRIPAVITDRDFSAVYGTDAALSAGEGELQAALAAPVALTPDEKLSGREIRAGYAFWTEDESAVHRAQESLLEANGMIEQENDLIRAETEQKEKDAYLQSRHRIYHEIAAELYPCQKRIGQLLEEAVPGTAGFREKIAAVSVLNAYVKRKTNLLLLAAENPRLSVEELFLALQESANYLTLAGLQTTAGTPGKGLLPAGRIVALYDAFEQIAGQLLGKAPSLMVSWNGKGLRLAAETDCAPDAEGLPLPVEFRGSEDVLFMDILPGEDGEAE